MMKARQYLLLASLGMLLPVCVEARPQLSFVKPTDLPALGVRVKLMPEAREVPLPSPAVYLFQFTRGDETWKEERFSPMELWRHSQCAGQWVGRDESTLLLASMTRLPPAGDARQPVPRAIYEQQSSAGVTGSLFATEAEIVRWVAAFSDCPNPVGKRVNKQFYRISSVWVFRVDSGVVPRVAYVFRLPRGAGRDAGSGWMCALFALNPQLQIDQACETIEKQFLEPLSTLAVSQTAGRAPLPRTGKGVEESAELTEARQQVVASIRNLKGWWYDITPDYIILSNLKGGSGSIIEQLKTSMKVVRTGYRRCIPEPEDSGVGVIRIPATQQEYRDYVGEENSWTGGLWVPGRKELVICPAGEQGAREKRLSILRVAFHEGFHQYAFYAFGQANAAMWFNEGLAQLFENASVSNGRLVIGESPQAMALLKAMGPGGHRDLGRLLRLSREEFYHPDMQLRAANYALAWAFVYYLKKGQASPFSGMLDDYILAMRRNGGNAEAATETMLTGVDLKKLQLDFERFWQSTTRQAAARRYDPLKFVD